MKFHYLARAIIQNNNKILLVREKGSKFTFLPGGQIEFSEAAKVVLKRELKEETGLDFEVINFIGAIEHTWSWGQNINSEVNLLFCAETEDVSKISSKEQHIEFIWVSIDEISEVNLRPEPLIQLLTHGSIENINSYWTSTIE